MRIGTLGRSVEQMGQQGPYPGGHVRHFPSPSVQPETASDDVPADTAPSVLKKLQKWGDYESVGQPVAPTLFIPMKTPLSNEILANWSLLEQPKHRLTVPDMLRQQHNLGRKVGLILDLSNHACLYSADVPDTVAYKHIQLVAKELPQPEFVSRVRQAARAFWEQNPDEYIAIHCAYGFNRTGFVVCCYLIEECGLSVDAALNAFAEARPPGVKHENFRQELHRRYSRLNSCVLDSMTSMPSVIARDNSSMLGPVDSQALADLAGMLMQSENPPLPSTIAQALGSSPLDSTNMLPGQWLQQQKTDDTCCSTTQAPAAGANLPAVAVQCSSSFEATTPPAACCSGSETADTGRLQRSSAQSENESLGFSDRLVLAAFREQPGQPTPESAGVDLPNLETKRQERTREGPTSPFRHQSINDIIWHQAAPAKEPMELHGQTEQQPQPATACLLKMR